MLIIEIKENESIERALKRYKRKHRNVKLMREIRKRKEYTKKSTERRETIMKAQYREKFLNNDD
ncbi:MAG: 30S ribosomal protein S21 [Bacteroidia bacterium]|nr:30S ribosomal protein S21 [Bacteroidia bacterium]MBT8268868.1 30S ribosomal protein S21 [Bacteroidia bacterium]NNF82868.1 30S ribosomal protein S21 [Flavobacteriaceae bacterium]NNK69541.1 30S ribosomal protein S21 [Flavobacteriaceae bacterium]NNL80378.1 30S ribosomal protein S21 [Flavobacteriaceae bacterium]